MRAVADDVLHRLARIVRHRDGLISSAPIAKRSWLSKP
jgi:hypothetical protein